MNISVLKNNQIVCQVDLAKEIQGIGKGPLSFYVGRSEQCHICLDDMMISREHAKITFQNGGWSIEKISTLSDVMINGQSINQAAIKSGDVINIGPYLLNIFIQDMPKHESIEAQKEEVSGLAIEDENKEITEVTKPEQTQTVAEIEVEQPLDEEISSQDLDIGEDETEKELSSEILDDHEAEEETIDPEDAFGDDVSSGFEESTSGEDSLPLNEESQLIEDGDSFAMEESSESSDEEGTRVFQSFVKIELDLFGEFAPYDKFVIEQPSVYIGRDAEKCQIVLNDPEVSTVHAVINKSNANCTIEDLQSGNGTLLNGSRINKSELSNGDEFIIGNTTFTVHISSDFMQNEEKRLMPVEENQVVEVEEIVEVENDFEDGAEGENPASQEKSLIKRIWKDPKKRKKLIIGGALLMALMMFMEEDPPPPVAGKNGQGKVDGKNAKVVKEQKKKYTKEQEEFLSSTYLLAKDLFDTGKYPEAIVELEKIKRVDPDYKETKQLIELASEGLRKLEELEKKRQAEIERKERLEKVKELVVKAKDAVKEKQVTLAEALFNKILEMDPENFDIPQLKLELDAWKKEQERLRVEEAQKIAERNRKVALLQPSKTYYLKKDWYRAILKLEEFLKIKDMDEDLTQEATKMLDESKTSLKEIVDPLIGKARSLKEGQDLKGAYEHYNQVLYYDPINLEALNEMQDIRELLNARSRKIYREGLISESLSLFDDAKEKFQEVQQVSPTDSDYYKKATDKLKDYLE